jgi:hypothetical protein
MKSVAAEPDEETWHSHARYTDYAFDDLRKAAEFLLRPHKENDGVTLAVPTVANLDPRYVEIISVFGGYYNRICSNAPFSNGIADLSID